MDAPSGGPSVLLTLKLCMLVQLTYARASDHPIRHKQRLEPELNLIALAFPFVGAISSIDKISLLE